MIYLACPKDVPKLKPTVGFLAKTQPMQKLRDCYTASTNIASTHMFYNSSLKNAYYEYAKGFMIS